MYYDPNHAKLYGRILILISWMDMVVFSVVISDYLTKQGWALLIKMTDSALILFKIRTEESCFTKAKVYLLLNSILCNSVGFRISKSKLDSSRMLTTRMQWLP